MNRKNKSSNDDGLFRVLLKEGTDKAKIIVKGQGNRHRRLGAADRRRRHRDRAVIQRRRQRH